jgi:hypothetical protein
MLKWPGPNWADRHPARCGASFEFDTPGDPQGESRADKIPVLISHFKRSALGGPDDRFLSVVV